jgi:HEAT repeat protein
MSDPTWKPLLGREYPENIDALQEQANLAFQVGNLPLAAAFAQAAGLYAVAQAVNVYDHEDSPIAIIAAVAEELADKAKR